MGCIPNGWKIPKPFYTNLIKIVEVVFYFKQISGIFGPKIGWFSNVFKHNYLFYKVIIVWEKQKRGLFLFAPKWDWMYSLTQLLFEINVEEEAQCSTFLFSSASDRTVDFVTVLLWGSLLRPGVESRPGNRWPFSLTSEVSTDGEGEV